MANYFQLTVYNDFASGTTLNVTQYDLSTGMFTPISVEYNDNSVIQVDQSFTTVAYQSLPTIYIHYLDTDTIPNMTYPTGTYGVLIRFQGTEIYGRWDSDAELSITMNNVGEATVSGNSNVTLIDVNLPSLSVGPVIKSSAS